MICLVQTAVWKGGGWRGRREGENVNWDDGLDVAISFGDSIGYSQYVSNKPVLAQEDQRNTRLHKTRGRD